MALSARLQAILEFAKGCKILADIGTDHAYLPIEAVRTGFCQKAIACDVNKGPLESAAKNIQLVPFLDRLETRLGNGLAPLEENEADCIVISGMGGMLIWDILQAQPTKARFAEKLILQPQQSVERLRRNLHGAGYEITTEKLVYEDARFYAILVARCTGDDIAAWTDREYFVGKYLCESPHYLQYLQQEKDKIARYIHFLNDDAGRLAEMRLGWIESKMLEKEWQHDLQ
ncbi:MAG: class I SAM-dependent methyltransferase [Firmicutes bacterium]|nr:class I SAM-dependent methyltransferase [Bacillota bacterium]